MSENSKTTYQITTISDNGRTLNAWRIGNIVTLSYNVVIDSVTEGTRYTLLTLPAEYRPPKDILVSFVGITSDVPSTTGRFVIKSSGLIQYCSSTLNGLQELSFTTTYCVP